MSITPELERLLAGNLRVWRGGSLGDANLLTLPTGHAQLDAVLPGGGWPVGALTELVVSHWGIGELRLLLPALSALSQAQRWLVWIAPPYAPYAPALLQAGVDLRYALLIEVQNSSQDVFWSMEKLLRNPATGIVMAWPRTVLAGDLRRLQLAAEAGQTLGMLFHQRLLESTPAALRLQLNPVRQDLEVSILKARGSLLRRTVVLSV
jgi:hypothetical protein